MKTAISIPDDIFRKADALARKRRMSRSALYTAAIQTYVADADGAELSKRLHDYYDHEDSSLDPALLGQQMRNFRDSDW